MDMNIPPFFIGDKVTIVNRYFHNKAYLNDIVRTVIHVKRSSTTRSGWTIYVDGPNYHKKGSGLAMDAGWFIKAANADKLHRSDFILQKIMTGINASLSDAHIDLGFQRHVTKTELIGCIRQLLIKNSEVSNGQNKTPQI